MAFYLIGYETRGTRPYDGVQEAIDREGGIHLIDNLWALESTREAAELRDWVHQLMDDSDPIFVIQVKKKLHWASRHLKSSVNDWLKARL